MRFCLLLLVISALPLTAPRADGADGRFSERSSSHFRLHQDVAIERYSGSQGSRQFERDVLKVLEGAYTSVGRLLRVRPKSKITVVVYDSQVFDDQFNRLFGFRAAGFFDGIIHVRSGTRVDERLVRTLYHEYVHAALEWEAGNIVPAWLNEGLAEYMEALSIGKRGLSFAENDVLVRAAQSGQWIPMRALAGGNFAHMGSGDASLAYLEAYALIEYMIRKYGDRELRALIEHLTKTRNASRALDRVYRRSLSELEEELLGEIL